MRLLRAANAEPVLALGFSPDGRTLVAGHESRGLFAWPLGDDRAPILLGADSHTPCRNLYFDPDGRTVYWMTPAGRAAADCTTGVLAVPGPPLARHLAWFAQSPDARRVFTAHTPSRELFSWHGDGRTWTRAWSQSIGEAFLRTLALDPSGARLAYLGEKPGPRWWPDYTQLVVLDTATGDELAHGSYRYLSNDCRLIFRPDGQQLVGLHNMTMLIWTAPKWGAPHIVVRKDTRKHFTAAAFDPSGRHLYTASNDANVVVWDVESWERVRVYSWDIGRLKSVALSPDGTLAAAGTDDGAIVVWDVE